MQPASTELDLARAAFVAAHSRFQADHSRRNIEDWYASLGETLWWIFALDDYFRSMKNTGYEQFRDGDRDGRVIYGLALARNRVGHGLAIMLEDPEGRSVFEKPPVTTGIVLDQLRWRALGDPPPESRSKERITQRKAYHDYLEGRPARYSLRHANYFFIRRRLELDSQFL